MSKAAQAVVEVVENETVNVDEMVAANASKEEKLQCLASHISANPGSWISAIPSAALSAMEDDKLNGLLESLALLTEAALDRVVVRNITSKEAKRDYTKVLLGFSVESARQVDMSIYVPVDWTEQDVIDKLASV